MNIVDSINLVLCAALLVALKAIVGILIDMRTIYRQNDIDSFVESAEFNEELQDWLAPR